MAAYFQRAASRIDVVLEVQQRRTEAQVEYHRAVGEYNKMINYVAFVSGTLLANNNISLTANAQ